MMTQEMDREARMAKGEEAQEAIYAKFGLPKNPVKRFEKMTDALFGETVPVFPVQPAGENGDVRPEVAVGDNVQLFASGIENEEGDAERFTLAIEARTRQGEGLGFLVADEEQLLTIAVNVSDCIAFVHALDPFEVKIDLMPRVIKLTQARIRDLTRSFFSFTFPRESSVRYKSQKTYLSKRPERMAAFGCEEGESQKKRRACSATDADCPIDDARAEALMKGVRDSFEGKVRPATVKQLEQESAEYKAAKKELTSYAKSKSVGLTDLLKQHEVVSSVAMDDSIPRPPQDVVDAWYEEAGLAPLDAPETAYPDLCVLAFSYEVDSKYNLEEGPAGEKVYELFRTGDVLKCRGVVDELWADSESGSLQRARYNNLRFDFLGEENAIVTKAYRFCLSSIKRAGYYDYDGEDLALLVSEPDACGVPERGVQARVLGTSGGRGHMVVAIEVSIALDEGRYRELRRSVHPNMEGNATLRPISITMETPGRGSATFKRTWESNSGEYILANEAAAGDFVKAYAGAFKAYKSPVKKTVVDGGLTVPVEYKPSRAFTQLEKYLQEGKRVALASSLSSDDWADLARYPGFYDEGPRYGVARQLLATHGDSAKCLVDMMRVLALLTDDEMIERVVKEAPRKKDGKLAAGRLAISVDMDGIFDDGTFYNVRAKSDSSGAIEIMVKKNQQHWQSEFYGGASKFLEENADIVKRMGLW